MNYLRVRNYERYQHYTERRPVWVKLYIELLDDYELSQLPICTRLVFNLLLLVAAEQENHIPYDTCWIAERIRIRGQDVSKAITNLLVKGFLEEELSTGSQPSLSRVSAESQPSLSRVSAKSQPSLKPTFPLKQAKKTASLLAQSREREEKRREDLEALGVGPNAGPASDDGQKHPAVLIEEALAVEAVA